MPILHRLIPRLLLLISLSILLPFSPAAHAQVPKGDLFFGYSRTGSDTFYPNVGGLNGWEGTAHFKIGRPFLGIEGDVAHYGLGADSAVPRTTTVLFGPRVTVKAIGIHLFAHGLVGGQHSANSAANTPVSGGSLAYALGGGVDAPLAPFFAWRIQLDRLSAPTVSPAGGNPVRFTTGIVFRF
ncbi:MAG: hypothetical protein WAM85_17780 [Terracidiphilus sp.]